MYWVVTEDELIIVTLRHFSCCSCWCPTGDKVQTIPLENIRMIETRGKREASIGCFSYQVLPYIYVDIGIVGDAETPRTNYRPFSSPEHDAIAIALQDQESLKITICKQSRLLQRNLMAAPEAQVMGLRGE
jgi:hypothetical protein